MATEAAIPTESQDILQEAQVALKQAEMTFVHWKQRSILLEEERDEAVTLAATAQGEVQAYRWIVERLESFGELPAVAEEGEETQ